MSRPDSGRHLPEDQPKSTAPGQPAGQSRQGYGYVPGGSYGVMPSEGPPASQTQAGADCLGLVLWGHAGPQRRLLGLRPLGRAGDGDGLWTGSGVEQCPGGRSTGWGADRLCAPGTVRADAWTGCDDVAGACRHGTGAVESIGGSQDGGTAAQP